MKRGGIGPDYIRKTVDKVAITAALTALEADAEIYVKEAEDYTRGAYRDILRAHAAGLRKAIDVLERDRCLLEGHPTRGWW